MNKDDIDLYLRLRNLSKHKTSNASSFVNGLENRSYGYSKKNDQSKKNLEIFAEEAFVRKNFYDEMRCEMPGLPRCTFLMVFSPDGSKVASTHGNHNIYITDIKTGKNIKTLVGHPRTPWCIAFHPTSDQIVASGCLGGQVRIWDLKGGSEVWTAVNQTVIASLAFHPNDRILVIATCNGVYFWDWSQPEPFVHAATSNPKEKVRYVAFDKLGHKLITGIANSPQTRWERVRAPVPVPRQERCASPYRRRITQRLANSTSTSHLAADSSRDNGRESVPNIRERERRITMCYRNLVREYEQLVQRYLQLYRPPTMIDRGTDPMEPNPWFNTSGTQTSNEQTGFDDVNAPGPSRLNTSETNTTEITITEPVPSTSDNQQIASTSDGDQGPESDSTLCSHTLITPSKIFSAIKKPTTSFRGTQTGDSRKHKADASSSESTQEKRFKKCEKRPLKGSASKANCNGGDCTAEGTSTSNVLVVDLQESNTVEVGGMNEGTTAEDTEFRLRSKSEEEGSADAQTATTENPSADVACASVDGSTSTEQNSGVEELLLNIRRTAEEEVRNRILPIINSVPANDRPELIRLFENGRENVRKRYRQMYPVFLRRPNRRHLNIIDSSDSSSSEEENLNSPDSGLRCNLDSASHARNTTITASSTNVTSTTVTSSGTVRNFNTELEQLVTSLLTEIERDDRDRPGSTAGVSHTTATSNTSSSSNPLPSPVRFEFSPSQTSTSGTSSSRSPPPLASLLFQECLRMLNSRDETSTTSISGTTSTASAPSTSCTTTTPTANDPTVTDTTTITTPTTTATNTGTPPSTFVNTNTGTTNSTIYTSCNSIPPPSQALPPPAAPGLRPPTRRFFSHRISAFMPTRVHYTRSPRLLRRGSLGSRLSRQSTSCHNSSPPPPIPPVLPLPPTLPFSQSSFALDELVNYAERENSEDDIPQERQERENGFSSLDPLSTLSNSDSIFNIYSNIIHDIESSLRDVVAMRVNNVLGDLGETSSMLGGFSERLENIVNQSDTILRHIINSMEMISNTTGSAGPSRTETSQPTFRYYDNSFYVQDYHWDSPGMDVSGEEPINLRQLFSAGPPLATAVAADHTYPRNPEIGHSGVNEDMLPIMNLIHTTVSHIQRQARQLRQRVEAIERLDREMREISQLELIRQLLVDLIRYLLSGEGRTRNTGMSSVRQMMAGTRISDSSPRDSNEEESNAATSASQLTNQSAASSSSANAEEATTSNSQERPRTSHRKTYPPSRLYRLSRQCRRPNILHFISRRYLHRAASASGLRHRSSSATPSSASGGGTDGSGGGVSGTSSRTSGSTANFNNFSPPNANTFSAMTRRMDQLLSDQVRMFVSNQPPQRNTRPSYSVNLGEHILMLRLHGCILRMNRLLGNNPPSTMLGNQRADPTAAVTHDGVSRYEARYYLSILIDNISRNMEIGTGMSANLRNQIHRVLAMGLLLTELMLLVVTDGMPSLSTPSPSDRGADRESPPPPTPAMGPLLPPPPFPRRATASTSGSANNVLFTREHARQLLKSLQLMKATVRRAGAALGQTYAAHVSALRRRQQVSGISERREEILASVNRCLAELRQRNSSSNDPDNTNSGRIPTQTDNTSQSSSHDSEDWYDTVLSNFDRSSENSRFDHTNEPSTSSVGESRPSRIGVLPSSRLQSSPRYQDSETNISVSDNANSSSVDWTTEGYSVSPPQDEDFSQPSTSASVSRIRNRFLRVSPTLAPLPFDVSDPDDSEAFNTQNYMYRVNSSNSGEVRNNSSSGSSTSRSYTVPAVRVNDVPVTEPTYPIHHRILSQFADRVSELRSYPTIGLFRPRFLHPLYANVSPFDADLDDPQRDQIYEGAGDATVTTSNNRIQVWDVSDWQVPVISNALKNVVVGECKIHNDASVDIAKDGTILVTLLPSGGYLNVTNRVGVYSLRWETLGHCLYTTSFEQNAVSVSLSPQSRLLVVGLASRIVPSDRWMMARIFRLEQNAVPGDRMPMVRELQQNRDSRMNCIRWLPTSGQGLIYATNTGQLVVLS